MVKERIGEQKFQRVKVDDDAYVGVVVGANIFQTTGYNGSDVEKVRFDIEIETTEDKEKVQIPLFMTATISDAGLYNARYRNSALYDLLELSQKLDDYFKVRDSIFADGLSNEEQNKVFVDFIRQAFERCIFKVLTKTVKPVNGEPYSVVNEVIKFLGTEEKNQKKKESAKDDKDNDEEESEEDI